MDHLVVPGAQADQVVQVGAAAVDPVPDVVQVGPAGLAAGEPAPAVVPFAGGAADRGAGAAAAPAQGQHRAGVAVGHPGQRGGAGDHLRGGHADRRAVLDMAPGRVRRVTRDPRRGRPAFPRKRQASRPGPRPGEHAGAGVHHDLVDLRVIGPGHLPGQERLRHRDQPVSQVQGRPDRRGRPRRAFPRERSDIADRPQVVLVSQSMAKRFWGSENPIGKRLRLTFFPEKSREVVGVVGDIKQDGLNIVDPVATLYLPRATISQPLHDTGGAYCVAVRKSGCCHRQRSPRNR